MRCANSIATLNAGEIKMRNAVLDLFNNEKWVRCTLYDANISADVLGDAVYVRNETDQLRAQKAMEKNVAIRALPVHIKAWAMR